LKKPALVTAKPRRRAVSHPQNPRDSLIPANPRSVQQGFIVGFATQKPLSISIILLTLIYLNHQTKIPSSGFKVQR